MQATWSLWKGFQARSMLCFVWFGLCICVHWSGNSSKCSLLEIRLYVTNLKERKSSKWKCLFSDLLNPQWVNIWICVYHCPITGGDTLGIVVKVYIMACYQCQNWNAYTKFWWGRSLTLWGRSLTLWGRSLTLWGRSLFMRSIENFRVA